MKKRLIILVLLITFVASGAFGLNLTLGLNGALYMDDGEYQSWDERFDAFKEGEGIYYGLLLELLGENVGLGFNYYASIYDSYFGVEMIDMDVNLHLSYHLLGSTFFLDPFGEIGVGYIAKDYNDEELRTDIPITAMNYWHTGLGLGVNLGGLGVFGKFIYHFEMGAPTVEETVYNKDGTPVTYEYPLSEYALKPYKFVLGAKLIF